MGQVTGFKIRGLDADTDRISVQSSAQSSHLLTRRKFPCLPAKWTTVEMGRDELVVLKCNHGTASVELKHLGGPHGALRIDEGGQHRQLLEGSTLRLTLRADYAVFLTTRAYQVPRSRGAQFQA